MRDRRIVAGIAVVGATGAVTGVGVLSADTKAVAEGPTGAVVAKAAASTAASPDPAVRAALRERSASGDVGAHTVSRGSSRPTPVSVQRVAKSRALPVAKQNLTGGVTETVAPADPKDIARGMLAQYGWSSAEFTCLDEIYTHESGWDPTAMNPSSGAFGIPQALPGDKMAAYGADWQTNPSTQLAWGLAYIRDRYGSPCGAWGFWESNSWY